MSERKLGAVAPGDAALRAVVERGADAVVLIGADGTTRYQSPAMGRMLGWSAGELGGQSWLDHVHHGDRARFAEQLARVTQGAPAELLLALRVMHRDGGIRWLEGACSNQLGDPLVASMLWSFRDITTRMLAVEALTYAVEAAALGGWSLDLKTGGVQHSLRHDECFGYTQEIPGWSYESFLLHVDEADRLRVDRGFQRAKAGHVEYDEEFRTTWRDGSVHWLWTRGRFYFDERGSPYRVAGIVSDVSERRRAEALLGRSQQRLAIATESAGIGIWDWDILRDVMHWDDQMYALYGVVEPAFTGAVDAWHAGLHPDDRASAASALADALAGTRDFHTDFRIVRPDGEMRHIEAHGLVQREADGSPRRMIGVNWDITDRKRGEQALLASERAVRQREAALAIASRAARLGGWSISIPEHDLSWSEEVCAIHELPPGSAPSLEEALAFYAPEFQEPVREKLDACALRGDAFDLEAQIVTATGRRVWVRLIGNAEYGTAGAVTCIRGAFQNIDERHKLQDQFRQAQKMEAVGRLAGGVAHDFNNLLSVILSYAELAHDSLEVSDPVRQDIDEIRRAGQRAADLTRQLLAFSRQQVLAPRVVDLYEIVLAMKPMLGRLLGEDIEVAMQGEPRSGRVLVDPSQVEQVVMNLAVNARDAMAGGGTLTFEVMAVDVDAADSGKPAEVLPGTFLMLTVTDTGAGMTDATRARIFEPFFTTKEIGKGTGLGLATVFGIVQQSGGFITVHSKLEEGTAFKLYFPCTERGSPAPSADPSGQVLTGTETILLVEDEQQLRAVGSAVLRRHGYTVLEAANGSEALLVANAFASTIHLLLTDVVMPRMNGRRLAEALTAIRPALKVLFASGYTDDTTIHHGVLEAGVAFLQKPFTPPVLLRKVREVLGPGG